MSKFRERTFLIRFLIVLAYLSNFILALILTIADVVTDLSTLLEFSFWLEFITTIMLGYSSMALAIILSMENTKEDNQNYQLVKGSLIEINKEISTKGLSKKLSKQVDRDNTVRHLKAYLVKCDKKRSKSEKWQEEFESTHKYLKAFQTNQPLDDDFTLDNKKVRYTKIKESALLTGRITSTDDDELGINTFGYVVEKKLPFLLVGFFVSIILAILTFQLSLSPEGLIDLVGKVIIMLWNSILGYVLGVDIIETYHITQMNKVRLYLRKFLDGEVDKV